MNDPDVLQALSGVIDPEVGVSIVDLGLVYRAERTPDAIVVALTPSTPSCPLSEMLVEQAREASMGLTLSPLSTGYRSLGEPLVLILHAGYAFIPIGLLLLGGAAFDLVPATAGIHAWTAGAIGTMTLAVMTRASLGHTGHDLAASAATQLIYALVVIAACARIGAALAAEWTGPLLELAAFAWAGAFLGFAIVYGPLLWRRKAAGALAQ